MDPPACVASARDPGGRGLCFASLCRAAAAPRGGGRRVEMWRRCWWLPRMGAGLRVNAPRTVPHPPASIGRLRLAAATPDGCTYSNRNYGVLHYLFSDRRGRKKAFPAVLLTEEKKRVTAAASIIASSKLLYSANQPEHGLRRSSTTSSAVTVTASSNRGPVAADPMTQRPVTIEHVALLSTQSPGRGHQQWLPAPGRTGLTRPWRVRPRQQQQRAHVLADTWAAGAELCP